MPETEPKYMARVNRLKKKVFETYPEIDLEDLHTKVLQTAKQAAGPS